MKSLLKFYALSISLMVIFTTAAHAEPYDQIKSAIAKGDYIEVQNLVNKNPELAGRAEVEILGLADGLSDKSAQLLTLAANISSDIGASYVEKISLAAKKIVEALVKQKPSSPEQSDSIVSMFNSVLTLAKSKAVNDQDPDLARWAEARLEDYSDQNDVLLAQLPNGGYYPQGNGSRYIPLALFSLPPPPGSSGSPSE